MNIEERVSHIKDPSKRVFIKEFFEELKEEYKDKLISLIVFGSVARGDDSPSSDLDLLLVLDTNECFFDRTKRIARMLNKIRKARIAMGEEYNFSIDVYPLNLNEAQCFRPIYLDLCYDAIIAYDRGSFFRKLLTNLKSELAKLGSIRSKLPNGSWIWILKPDLKFGEEFKIAI